MLHHFKGGKDNALLVDFESVINLDYAMYRYARKKYGKSKLLNQDLFKDNISDNAIRAALLERRHINPFEIFIPSKDPELLKDLYYKVIEDPELLDYAEPYDTFRLMLTFLREASSVYIEIRCDNQAQADYIQKISNGELLTNVKKRCDVPIDEYSVIYVKYLIYVLEYPQPLMCKNIYVHTAGYNMLEESNSLDPRIVHSLNDYNKIMTIDPYREIKYIPPELIIDKGDVNDGSNKESV